MKSFEKKKEIMRKIIVSQEETINRQIQEIESLTNDNLRLYTEYEKMNKVMTQFKEYLDNFAYKNDEYIKIKKHIRKARRKIIKIKRIRQGGEK